MSLSFAISTQPTQAPQGPSHMLLAARSVGKSYGVVPVLHDVSLRVHRGERAGLVGANGAGKSTLLRILTGQETPDAGTITLAPGAELGYLAQGVVSTEGTTLDDVLREAAGGLRRIEEHLRALEAALAAPNDAGDAAAYAALLDEYGALLTRYQDRGGYELDARIAAVLDGMRLAYLPRGSTLATLSGGERARVGLAALLVHAPDVLLLDEPTNHLDAATLAWLEGYLAGYEGGVLVVSHDRQFLNRTVQRIYELDEHSHGLKTYGGDYDAYARAKAAERTAWEEEYARQQEEIAALRVRMRDAAKSVAPHNRQPRDSFRVAYNAHGESVARAVSSTVRNAKERLARIEDDLIPETPKPLRFRARFGPGQRAELRSNAILRADRLGLAYGDRWLFRGVDVMVGPRARVLLTGPNGAGKTTLLRLLLGELTPTEGTVHRAPAARIGVLPQEPAPPRGTVLEVARAGTGRRDDEVIAGLIGYGLFRLEDVAKPVSALSMGQRRKLELARLMVEQPNVLALDEPTNYLALDVLDAFEAAITAFPGPVLAISHDRWFLRRFGLARGDGGDPAEVWHLSAGTLTRTTADEYLARIDADGGDEGEVR